MPILATTRAAAIADTLAAWYRAGRRDLPFRKTRDPYAIWVSEIMLQQTRVATVIPYWQRWMAKFPTVRALAASPLDDVLASWAGLGYYSRARNLHRGASDVVTRYGGALPGDAVSLRTIPGIGAYTAGAIASIAFDERTPLVDGNVSRVLARVLPIEADVKSTAGNREVWTAAATVMAALSGKFAPGELNQGLMELGATHCSPRSPSCGECPLRTSCAAVADDRQAALPVLPARKKTAELPTIETVALWVLDEQQRVLLARRKPSGLFGGLWELPQSKTAVAAATELGATLLAKDDVVTTHRQVLSHRRLTVRVVPASIRLPPTGARQLGKLALSSYDAWAWHSLDKVIALGLAASTASILSIYAKDLSWNSITKRSNSSPRATPRSSKASRFSASTPTTRTTGKPPNARPKASTSSATIKRKSKARSKR